VREAEPVLRYDINGYLRVNVNIKQAVVLSLLTAVSCTH